MLRLRGRRGAPGMGLGTATILRSSNGIPMLPARVAEQAGRHPRESRIEPVDVVIVSREPELAEGVALPWARVVGTVTELPQLSVENRGYPTVSGVSNLMGIVSDDILLLIDGDNGVVLVDPDAAAIALYQSERDKIAPRKRVFLGYPHQPARTLDGKEVRVIASVDSHADFKTAVESGADGLFFDEGSGLLPPETSEARQCRALASFADAAGGKPMTFAWQPESVSCSALLRAASKGDITLALPQKLVGTGAEAILQGFDDAREVLIEADQDFGEIRLAERTLISGDASLVDNVPTSRLIVGPIDFGETIGNEAIAQLERLSRRATQGLVPLEFVLKNATTNDIAMAVGFGAGGVIVPPDFIVETKEHIRGLNVSSCRSAVFSSARDDG